jgi:hypothetical protein
MDKIETEFTAKPLFPPPEKAEVVKADVAMIQADKQKPKEEVLSEDLKAMAAEFSTRSDEDKYVMSRILHLLMSFVTSIQNIAIAQTESLSFLTKFQNAYTELQMQISTFTQDGKTPLGQKDAEGKTDLSNARNDLNTQMGIKADEVRTLRGIQENTAKKMQSQINTSNDAVNSMTDMITRFIEQTRELTSTVFR